MILKIKKRISLLLFLHLMYIINISVYNLFEFTLTCVYTKEK